MADSSAGQQQQQQQQQQEEGAASAAAVQSTTREQPQRQAKAPPGNGNGNGSSSSQGQQRNGGGGGAKASTSSSSAASASARQNSESGSSSGSSTALESIDAVCNAIVTIANIGGDAAMQYNVVRDNLLPALNFLEQKGTSGGVPATMILQSPLNGNRDPLVYLMQQPQLTGNGLGYLTILLARCCAENPNPHHLVPLILQYIQVADPRQLQLVPYKAQCLALWLAHFFGPEGAAACIEPLYNLLRKLQGDRYRHVLTAIHPILLLASLRANNYHVAMHMLQNYPVMEVDPKLFSVAYHDNLKYHLYAGTVAAVVGNYAMAIELLEAAVSAPAHANTGSLIQIDAYKRLVLVQLIQNGKTTSPPAYTSNHVTQTFRQLCAVYVDFARDYESLSRSKSYAYLADSKRTIFEQDGNLGLVQRALAALPSRAILDLQNVYRTIELGDVVRLVFPEESGSESSGSSKKDSPADPPPFASPEQAQSFIESEVQRLVSQRKLSAQIVTSPADPSKRYLEFLPTTSNSQESAAALQRALMSISDSRWTVSNLDARISGSRDFLKKAYEAVPKGGIGAGAAPGHHVGGMDYMQDFMGEEDLMDAKIPGAFED